MRNAARRFLALRGQFTYISNGEKPALDRLARRQRPAKRTHQDNDWNDVDIIARGNTIIQLINGHVMSALIDDDIDRPKNARRNRHSIAPPPQCGDEDGNTQYPA